MEDKTEGSDATKDDEEGQVEENNSFIIDEENIVIKPSDGQQNDETSTVTPSEPNDQPSKREEVTNAENQGD